MIIGLLIFGIFFQNKRTTEIRRNYYEGFGCNPSVENLLVTVTIFYLQKVNLINKDGQVKKDNPSIHTFYIVY